ncbi:MAG: hypothetical protein IJQ20_06010 [Paludibacteraceae bacterium]|nr:hypothetical protein [Paludibacteraceae bacterium]MBQ6984467.1 hypothetical protein [Paludibacteraceae bacterium]MBQ9426091.1 hypothetical protein [Paludibacteraceae bacterium]
MSEREIIVRCRARGTGYRMACGVSRGVARVRVYGMLAVLACCLLGSCTALMEKKQQAGAAVEVNGHYLYQSTLDSLTLGLSSEDSLRVTQQFISQWAKDMLMYDKGMENGKWKMENGTVKGERSEIERMVEEYRQALYVHSYERYLVEKRMSKTVLDSTIVQLYEQMPDRFLLDESMVRGMLVVVPREAKDLGKLRNWMSKNELDHIEKYVYQNASGYELFTEKWLSATDILGQVPMERADLETRLKTKNQIEVADSLKTYLLQVTDKHLKGERMPLEIARPEIEQIVLSARQVEFLNKEREKLYNEAIQKGEIKYF